MPACAKKVVFIDQSLDKVDEPSSKIAKQDSRLIYSCRYEFVYEIFHYPQNKLVLLVILFKTHIELIFQESLQFLETVLQSKAFRYCFRTNKPFNPLLGETYECDRMSDLGWRAISEQASNKTVFT